MEITAGPVVFDVGVITLVYPASGLETATKKRQPRLTKWWVEKKNDQGEQPQTLI